ncbi:MAG TPA: ABC transporter permease [Vicinamibacterales bacterium]|nr:ABC transporter permease [Vicinamibacterales bacterium]
MPEWTEHVRSRLSTLRLSPTREREIVEELSQHLEDRWRELRAGGACEEEATRLALAAFRDDSTLARYLAPLKQANEAAPITAGASSGWRLADVWQDLRYAVRVFRKQRAFTAACAMTLALGIGATSALFSIVDAVLLRPLPFREPDRLVRLVSVLHDGRAGGISYPDFLDWRSRSRAVESMAVYTPQSFALRGPEAMSQVRGAVVSTDVFTVLGARASVGRTFLAADGADGAAMTVVLSDSLWRDRFGADPSLVGRTIELDHRAALVIGVMPAGFEFPIAPERSEFWTPVAVADASMASQRGVHFLEGIARLAPGTSIEQSQAELGTIVDSLNRRDPSSEPRSIRVRPELAELVADVRSEWLLLFAAAGCLLLLACANVVNMLLARAASRRKELAVRFALGARRGRIVGQLLTEHAVLGAIGALLGLVFAYWCIVLLKELAPPDVPRLAQAGLQPGVVVFAIALSVAAVLMFGLLPALHASGEDPSRIWNLASRGRDDEAGGRIRRVLAVAQIAIATVLLTGGALLARTVVGLQRVDPGFSTTHLITFRVDLPDAYSPARERAFYDQVLNRLRAMPGVRAASAGYSVPLGGTGFETGTEVEGRTAPGTHDRARFNSVQPGFFQSLGIRLVAGRDFTAHDDLDSNAVAIVNEAFAHRYFPDGLVLGRHVRPGIGNGYPSEPLREIVGVVQDVRSSDLRSPATAEVSVPAAQCPSIGNSTIVVQSAFDVQGFAREARRVVAGVDPAVPVSRVKTIEQYLSSRMVEPRFSSFLLGLFAVLSSVLAAVGLYGLISYAVAERTREIGIRLALGSGRRGVLSLVLRQGAGIAVAGISLGVIAALGLTSWMASLLYGVGPRDPITLAGVAGLLFAVAVAACAIPGIRAMRVDPITAIRYE